MDNKEPKAGDKSVCDSCGEQIIFTGKYWEHIGASYRHPATPKKDKNAAK